MYHILDTDLGRTLVREDRVWVVGYKVEVCTTDSHILLKDGQLVRMLRGYTWPKKMVECIYILKNKEKIELLILELGIYNLYKPDQYIPFELM